MNKALLKKLVVALLLLYCVGQGVGILTNLDNYLWDFKTYYYAAKAYAAGLDPYDIDALAEIAPTKITVEYVYLPLTLWFFRLFSLMDYDTAFYLFLALKCLLLAVLIYLWVRAFLRKEMDSLFYPFCFLGFNMAIFRDITAGNISIIEQLLIWLAFYFYLKKGKPFLFCVLILVAATLKLTPILFLSLLLFSTEEKRHRYLLGSSFVFLVILLVSYVLTPSLFTGFLHNAGAMDERGIMNPATLPLIRTAFGFLEEKTGIAVPHFVAWLLFLGIVATVLAVTWRAMAILRSAPVQDKERIIVFLACVVYALILPRFKDYSYILLLVPTYFVLWQVNYAKGMAVLIVSQLLVTFLCFVRTSLPGIYVFSTFLCGYYSLVLAYCVWALYLYWIFAARKRLSSRVPAQSARSPKQRMDTKVCPSTRGMNRPPPKPA